MLWMNSVLSGNFAGCRYCSCIVTMNRNIFIDIYIYIINNGDKFYIYVFDLTNVFHRIIHVKTEVSNGRSMSFNFLHFLFIMANECETSLKFSSFTLYDNMVQCKFIL